MKIDKLYRRELELCRAFARREERNKWFFPLYCVVAGVVLFLEILFY